MTVVHPWDYSDTYAYLEKLRSGFGPVIITAAISGGVQGKEANPALPETPRELAQEARRAYEAGASAVHVHFRDPNNQARNTMSLEVAQEANHLIREACPDIIINNTTGGGPGTTMPERFEALQARPEMASLNLGPDMSRFRIKPRRAPLPHPHEGYSVDECFPFTYGIIEDLARHMLEVGIKAEMETYHPGQFWTSRDLIERDLIKPPYVFQFVMGYQTSSFPTPANLISLISELPPNSVFFTCGIGVNQVPMTAMSMLLGGHVRVGLEDNVYYRRGQLFESNGQAVERVARLAREFDRAVATPAQTRAILGLSDEPRRFELPVTAGTMPAQ